MADVSPAEIQEYLEGVDYPASKQDLINSAAENGAESEVMNTLRRLRDGEFRDPREVTRELSSLTQGMRDIDTTGSSGTGNESVIEDDANIDLMDEDDMFGDV